MESRYLVNGEHLNLNRKSFYTVSLEIEVYLDQWDGVLKNNVTISFDLDFTKPAGNVDRPHCRSVFYYATTAPWGDRGHSGGTQQRIES